MMITMNLLNSSTNDALAPEHAGLAVPAVRALRLAAVALLLGGAAAGAMAQYKIVGPNGQVTYTDKPPTPSDIRPAGNGAGNGGPAAVGGLPYETRQAMARYPITLYAAKACSACDTARQWLRNRGIPFNEYSIDNNASVTQLQQRFGGTTVPVITIGSQTVNGFSASDMQSFADAAGYPAQARLNGYSWPAAVPLVSVGAPVAAAPAAPPAPAPVAPPPATSSSGIQF